MNGGGLMNDMFHEVHNYLDMNVVIVDDVIAPFDIKKLECTFPGVDNATLASCLNDWLCAREAINKLMAKLF